MVHVVDGNERLGFGFLFEDAIERKQMSSDVK